MVNILITGATGFLGSNIINNLSKKKKFRFIYLTRKNSNFSRLKKFKKNKNYIINYHTLENIFIKHQIDLIIHCATNYGTKDTNISNIVSSNLFLPLKLLDLSKKYNIKRFINTDTVLKKNISLYTRSKSHFVEWLKKYSKYIYCCNVKIEHFFGPKDDESKFIMSIISKLISNNTSIDLTKGIQKRDFIFIDDVVSAFEIIISNSLKYEDSFKTFEIGTGKSIPIHKVVKKIKLLSKNNKTLLNFGKLRLRANEQMDIKVNNRELKKLGWKPKFNLQQGIKKTLKYYV